jgi:hypothetical protein
MNDKEMKAYIEQQQIEVQNISKAIMDATQRMGRPDSLMLALLGMAAKVAADLGISRDDFLEATNNTLGQLYDHGCHTPPMIKTEHRQ